MFSKEDLENYKELHSRFGVKIEEILNIKAQIEVGKDYYRGEIRELEFINGKIEITTYEESKCSCCSGENHYYTIPESYLYDENWQEDCKKKVEDKREKDRLKKEEDERQRKIKKEEQELEQYEKLKRKFEN